MTTPEHILLKVKLLINLKNSSNANEADNARVMAEKLILKYEISSEELESLKDKKPLYGEDEKLFSTIGIASWRQQLAVAVAKQFACQIVQEETVPVEGEHEFSYFAYGNPEDVSSVKFVYNSLSIKIEEFVKKKCLAKGPIYIDSYSEGVTESVKNNIYWNGIDLPGVKVPSRAVNEDKVLSNGGANLTKPKEEKPAEKSINVSSQSFIKDVVAYFKGIADGAKLDIQDVLELASESEEFGKLKE